MPEVLTPHVFVNFACGLCRPGFIDRPLPRRFQLRNGDSSIRLLPLLGVTLRFCFNFGSARVHDSGCLGVRYANVPTPHPKTLCRVSCLVYFASPTNWIGWAPRFDYLI